MTTQEVRTVPEGCMLAKGFPPPDRIAWPLVPARDIFELRYGRALVGSGRRAGAVPVYGTNGVCGSHDEPLFEGPGVILGRKGQGPLGVEWCEEDYWVIDTAYSLRALRDDIDLRFAFYLIRFVGLNHLKDGTSNPSLSRDTFGAQAFPLPSFPEQRRIAGILGALDDKIELNRRTNETLEAMARALFRAWFVDFEPVRAKQDGRPLDPVSQKHLHLFPDRLVDTEHGEIPEGWEWGVLGDFAEFAYGKPLKEEDRRPGPFPVMGSNGRIGWHDEMLVNGPGIVVGRKGNPGTVTWVEQDFYPIDTTFYVVSKLRDNCLHFLLYALGNLGLEGLGADSAVPGLNRNHAYMSPMLLPLPEVRAAFKQVVEPLFCLLESRREESRTLAATRDALLPKLLSGEVACG